MKFNNYDKELKTNGYYKAIVKDVEFKTGETRDICFILMFNDNSMAEIISSYDLDLDVSDYKHSSFQSVEEYDLTSSYGRYEISENKISIKKYQVQNIEQLISGDIDINCYIEFKGYLETKILNLSYYGSYLDLETQEYVKIRHFTDVIFRFVEI